MEFKELKVGMKLLHKGTEWSEGPIYGIISKIENKTIFVKWDNGVTNNWFSGGENYYYFSNFFDWNYTKKNMGI